MVSATEQRVVLVTGAADGIGLALVDELRKDRRVEKIYASARVPDQHATLAQRARYDRRIELVALDLTRPASISAAFSQIAAAGHLDLVINAAGVLHETGGMKPERRLAAVSADHLAHAFAVNASGPLLLAAALEPLLKKSQQAVFTSLSARVGSIGDNRLGGWYAYRASKAALNMFVRTLAIEWARLRPPIICAALHPGTVATKLSAPFTQQKNSSTVFTPRQSAEYLLGVIGGLTRQHSGSFLAWNGEIIPW